MKKVLSILIVLLVCVTAFPRFQLTAEDAKPQIQGVQEENGDIVITYTEDNPVPDFFNNLVNDNAMLTVNYYAFPVTESMISEDYSSVRLTYDQLVENRVSASEGLSSIEFLNKDCSKSLAGFDMYLTKGFVNPNFKAEQIENGDIVITYAEGSQNNSYIKESTTALTIEYNNGEIFGGFDHYQYVKNENSIVIPFESLLESRITKGTLYLNFSEEVTMMNAPANIGQRFEVELAKGYEKADEVNLNFHQNGNGDLIISYADPTYTGNFFDTITNVSISAVSDGEYVGAGIPMRKINFVKEEGELRIPALLLTDGFNYDGSDATVYLFNDETGDNYEYTYAMQPVKKAQLDLHYDKTEGLLITADTEGYLENINLLTIQYEDNENPDNNLRATLNRDLFSVSDDGKTVTVPEWTMLLLDLNDGEYFVREVSREKFFYFERSEKLIITGFYDNENGLIITSNIEHVLNNSTSADIRTTYKVDASTYSFTLSKYDLASATLSDNGKKLVIPKDVVLDAFYGRYPNRELQGYYYIQLNIAGRTGYHNIFAKFDLSAGTQDEYIGSNVFVGKENNITNAHVLSDTMYELLNSEEENQASNEVKQVLNENGATQSVPVLVAKSEEVDQNSLNETDKAKYDQLMEVVGDDEVVTVMDLSVFVADKGNVTDNEIHVSKLTDDITLNIDTDGLPEVEDGYERQFYAVAAHDNSENPIEKIDCNTSDGATTLSTDEFSMYVIAYKDVKKASPVKRPNSSSSDKTTVYVVPNTGVK